MMAMAMRGVGRCVVMIAALIAASASATHAGDGRAGALLDRIKQLNQTTRKWNDRVQRMQLTIVDRRGGEYRRELEVMTKRNGDASRSIMFLHAPPQVQGIGFLQWWRRRSRTDYGSISRRSSASVRSAAAPAPKASSAPISATRIC